MNDIYKKQGEFTVKTFPDARPLEHCLKLISEECIL